MKSGHCRALVAGLGASVIGVLALGLGAAGRPPSRGQSQAQPPLKGAVQQDAVASLIAEDWNFGGTCNPNISPAIRFRAPLGWDYDRPCGDLGLYLEYGGDEAACINPLQHMVDLAGQDEEIDLRAIQRGEMLRSESDQIIANEREMAKIEEDTVGYPHARCVPPALLQRDPRLGCSGAYQRALRNTQAMANALATNAVLNQAAANLEQHIFGDVQVKERLYCGGGQQPNPQPPFPPPQPGPAPRPTPNPSPVPQPQPTPQPPIPNPTPQPQPTPNPPSSSSSNSGPPQQGSSTGGNAVMCGSGGDWTLPGSARAGAPMDEYVRDATALTPAEVAAENKRGRYAYPQGNTPWCAIASSETLIHANTGLTPGLTALVGQVNQYYASGGQPSSSIPHGYSLDQAARLLGSPPYGLTTMSGGAGGSDPIGQLAQATSVGGPAMVGITLNQTTTTPGAFGAFPQTETSYYQHAIVVDSVQGTAPNRQVVLIDSVSRPTSTVWTNYYKEPEAEFLKAWQILELNNGATTVTRPMLWAYRSSYP